MLRRRKIGQNHSEVIGRYTWATDAAKDAEWYRQNTSGYVCTITEEAFTPPTKGHTNG